MKNIKGILTLIALFALCAGCSSGHNHNQTQNSSPKQENVNYVPSKSGSSINQAPSNHAKKRVIQRKEVTEVHAVNSKKDLMVAVKLKTFQRFNSQQIVKKIAMHLKKEESKRKVQVSSDKKIFSEVAALETDLKKNKVRQQQLEKKIKRINRFMKDQDPSKH